MTDQNRALFDCNDDGVDAGFFGALSSSVNFTLRNPSGIYSWLLQVWSPDGFAYGIPLYDNPPPASKGAPLLTLVGDTSGQSVTKDRNGVITSTFPGAGINSWLVRSIVNGGFDRFGKPDPNLFHERLIANLGPITNLHKPVITELQQFEPNSWAGVISDLIDALEAGGGGGGGLVVGGVPLFGDVPTWNGSGAVWQPAGGLAVLSFAPAVSLYECGQTVANPAFTASYNRAPATALLTNDANGESKDVHGTPTAFASSQSYTKSTPNQSVTWILTTTNGVRTCSATWGQKNFWGTSSTPANTSAFGRALAGSQLTTSRNASFAANPGGSEKIYFYAPTRYGTPTFTVGGFAGGFILRSSTISDTNAQGFTENYSLYESVATGLPGTTNVTTS